MNVLRRLLFPFSLIYGSITWIRNKLFDAGVFKTYTIPKKSIVVGNLSVGGTGKTPLVEYLLEQFQNRYKTSSLSRGYGRKTKGVIIANQSANSDTIGDEPMQYLERFGNQINVVVSEKRKEGAEAIFQAFPDNELIILDDAFQHRAVKAGITILVTPYYDLYSSDFVLPAGNLREFRSGASRADIVVVSKCPPNLAESEMTTIQSRLNFHNSNVFFSSVGYRDLTPITDNIVTSVKNILLVTGIGNPAPLIEHLTKFGRVEHVAYRDHHNFTASDIAEIHHKFDKFAEPDKIIVTTEKDYMRLKDFKSVVDGSYPWYYQPIEIEINRDETFIKILEDYVAEN